MTQPSMPSLPQLRAFDAVARNSSLTRAAASLRRSQPALTISIAGLERSLDVELLARGRNGAHLTTAGHILSRRTRRMLDRLGHAAAEAGAATGPNGWQQRLTEAHVRCLAGLAEHVTLESTSKVVGITPASLRRTMQSLERLTGRPLLQASSQGLVATRIGAQLARQTKLALDEIRAGMEEIEFERGNIRSRIAIGVVPMSATGLLTAAINDFLAAFPEATVSVGHGPYDPLLDDLRIGRIDMLYGVLRVPAGMADVAEEALFYNPYVIAVRKGHPLARVRRPSLDDLAPYDWIAPKLDTPRRNNLQLMFAGRATPPKVAIETSSLNVLRSLIASSDRITLLTRQEMADASTRGMLVALDLDPNVARGPDGIAVRKDWDPTPVQTRFIWILRDHCRRMRLEGRAAP